MVPCTLIYASASIRRGNNTHVFLTTRQTLAEGRLKFPWPLKHLQMLLGTGTEKTHSGLCFEVAVTACGTCHWFASVARHQVNLHGAIIKADTLCWSPQAQQVLTLHTHKGQQVSHLIGSKHRSVGGGGGGGGGWYGRLQGGMGGYMREGTNGMGEGM